MKVAFVTPWFGAGLEEGEEQHVFQVATRLAARGHDVEVLTTCGRSRRDPWRNDHPQGAALESGVTVRRFPIASGDAATFDHVLGDLRQADAQPRRLGIAPVPETVARAFLEQNLHSPGLLDHLGRHAREYSAVVFSDYRFGPTLSGMGSVPGRAFLRPWLRDETAAYLPVIENVFDRSRRILFGSQEEVFLATRLYGPAMQRKGVVVGELTDATSIGSQQEEAWESIAGRYEEALAVRRRAHAPGLRRRKPRAVHQLLPSIDYGDAISNQVVFTMEVLRDLGYDSDIFVLDMAEPMRTVARRFTPDAIGPQDGVLYHHAIGTALTAYVIRHPGPKALLYHNITPPRFFEPWDRSFARILERGRKELRAMARHFPVSAGVSSYNAEELREAGYSNPSVVPIFVEPLRWSKPADLEWMKLLQDGRTNILFVGRIVPNKCQQDLLYAFREYVAFDPEARLILVGVWPEAHPYARFVREEAERLGIASRVLMTSRVTEAQLLACYRTAHLFWSMSEHEGFCVPLIEAMWFDVPILAYRSSAIPETLGEAGMMFSDKGRWPELAALAHLLVEERELRQKVIDAQRKRRSTFLPEALLPSLLDLLAKLGSTAAPKPDILQPRMSDTTSQYPSMMRGQR